MNDFQERPLPEWWRGAFIYQIYPRSFFDTNGDGVGDLSGITEKLDYIASLGVQGVWICPFFKSPMKDFGYDVSDYRAIDPLFGTMQDFENLLKRAHDLNLKVIIDLVLSHTSNEHEWFQDPKKKDWYVWSPKPNNWVSVFGGSAWSLDQRYNEFYFHNFLKEQPDLNFHNPDVQEEVLNICRFWLDKGVDGFRLDVVNFYFHDPKLRDNPPRDRALGAATQFEGEDEYSKQRHVFDKSQPEMYGFLKRLRTLMDEYGAFTVGELGDDEPYKLAADYTSGDKHLHTTYNPQLMSGTHKTLTADLIRTPFDIFKAQNSDGWPSWAFSNHDVVRAASRWCQNGDGFSHDPALSKMLIALLGSLYGTMFLYQGEELGLPEAKLKFEDLQDPWGKTLWPAWQGRDGCRTPMPWNKNTPKKTWLPVPEAHFELSVDAQEQNINSTLHFTRRFLKWRKLQKPLILGDIKFKDFSDSAVLNFIRIYQEQKIECVFNLDTYEFSLLDSSAAGAVIFSSSS